MPALTQLYIHIVWSTWNRLPLVTADVEPYVYAAIVTKCASVVCHAIAVNGTEDHVHVLVQFVSTVTIAQLVGELKGASSHLVTHMVQPGAFFKWQRGCGAFTLSKRSVPQVQAYVRNQKQHHHTNTLLHAFEPAAD